MYTGRHYELKPEAVERTNVIQDMMLAREGLALTKHIENVVASEIRSVSVTLTPAQLKALSTDYITLIPAPSANQYIDVLSCVSYLDYNSIAYTNPSGAKTSIWYGDKDVLGSIPLFYDASGNFIVQTEAVMSKWIAGNSGEALSAPLGFAIMIANDDANDYATGNSNITFFLQYKIITIN